MITARALKLPYIHKTHINKNRKNSVSRSTHTPTERNNKIRWEIREKLESYRPVDPENPPWSSQVVENIISTKDTEWSGTNNVLSIILGGGVGSRLYPLTKPRSKPAVPLGANYRLIDIPVSNCINSDLNKIYCLTQYNSASLNRHVSKAYSNIGSYTQKGFIEILAAQQSPDNCEWFRGTADAVRQYLWLFDTGEYDEYLILSGDHLYRMDYKPFIIKHRALLADITVSAIPVDEEHASSFGLMKVNVHGRVVKFSEKPKGDALLEMRTDTYNLGLTKEESDEKPYLASMGIYIFSKDIMRELLMDRFPQNHDFGSEIIPKAMESGYKIQSYIYEGYWEDIGTIKSFFNANLRCNEETPKFTFYDVNAPVYTSPRFLPPTVISGESKINQSTIGDGCCIKDARLNNCVIGLRSFIDTRCEITNTLVMGADYYESHEDCDDDDACDVPLGIGQFTVIRDAIIDKNARIGEGCKIINANYVEEDLTHEKDGWVIKDYIVIICKDAIIPNNTVI